jgi:hypothetical protein
MPRPKKVTTTGYEPPKLFPVYPREALSLKEREEFRKFIASALGGKLIKNAYCDKPSTNVVPGGVVNWNEHAKDMSVNRLHQIQGWEMFEAAFFRQAEERISKPNQIVTEQYQEPGT